MLIRVQARPAMTRAEGPQAGTLRATMIVFVIATVLLAGTGLVRAQVQTRLQAVSSSKHRASRTFSPGNIQQPQKSLKQTRLSVSARARVVATYAKLPLSFEANTGQTASQVKFLSRGPGYTLFLTENKAVLALETPAVGKHARKMGQQLLWGAAMLDTEPAPGPTPQGKSHATNAVLRMQLVGANPGAKITGADALSGKSNYLIGNNPKEWQLNVPTYAKVRYQGVYPGVNLVYYGNQHQLEYDFVVAPGADPGKIQLRLKAPNSKLEIAKDGDLIIHLGSNQVRFRKPTIYQPQEPTTADDRSPFTAQDPELVSGHYVITTGNQIHFEIPHYDKTRPLVIDPILAYSTYLGGVLPDAGIRIATDSAGNAYVVGTTLSANFPVTSGTFQSALSGTNSCSLGGLFLSSLAMSFPCSDAFVAKVKADGSSLVYATYLGGNLSDVATSVAVDSSGDAYVAGSTKSTNFPTTSGAYQTSPAALDQGGNAFIAKLNPSGSGLVYSTLLGGSSKDFALGIAIDASGDAYVTGPTDSTDFPTTAGAYETTIPGGTSPCAVNISTAGFGSLACWHGFVTEVNPSGASLVYSTYLGGSSNDTTTSIAVDSSGSTYVAGATLSTDFPTVSAYQSVAGGGNCLPSISGDSNRQSIQRPCSDAFVAKLQPGGSALAYSTYLGGGSDDAATAIAVDSGGNAYVTGITNSSNFPTTSGSLQPTFGGGSCVIAYAVSCPDAFVTKLNATGNSLVYSTYLGGNSYDLGTGIAVDASGDAFVVGATSSSNFLNVSALQAGITGSCTARDTFTGAGSITFNCPDAFVTEINPSGSAAAFSTFLGGSNYDFALGVALDKAGGLYMTGFTISTDFPTQSALQATAGMLGDGFVAEVSGFTAPVPAASLTPSTLSFNGVAVGDSSSSQDVTLSNSGGSSLTISSISITGTNNGDFSQTNTCGTSLAAGSNCTISVTFTPTAAGSRSGTLSVSDNAASSPQTAALSGTGQDFALTARTTSQTVAAGGTASYDLLLSPQGGFNQTVDLTCSGAPKGASCTVQPTSATLDGTTDTAFSVKVSTTAASVAAPRGPGNFAPPSGDLPVMQWLALILVLIWSATAWVNRKDSPLRRVLPFVTLALLVTLWAACGGGTSSTPTTNSNATPTGTYTLTVTGTAGNLTHTADLTLKVQ